jgi:nucleotide-binding universal stress UspA family protein
MTYKTIVVVLERDARPEFLETAFSVACDMDAHVVGLYVIRSPKVPTYAIAEVAAATDHLNALFRAELVRAEQSARAAFEAVAKRYGHSRIEWRVAKDEAASAVSVCARYADLVIAAQPEPGKDDLSMELNVHNTLALSAGRPVLHIPYAGKFPACGKTILVAWNASREAARAVADSLPLLRRANSVRVLVVDPGVEHGEVPGADLALYLARHGVNVDVAMRSSAEIGIGQVLLSDAADAGADLIVMGAYGHSKITEWVLGGATRTLLESMTVPVLMSH